MAQTADGTPSVWERSRQLAAREIVDTAIRLFTAHGYEETTTAQIAREAGVSQRTLYRYFGTKEDLLCRDQEELGALFGKTVGEQPADASAWDALRTGFAALTTANLAVGTTAAAARLIFEVPALRAGYVQKRLAWQADLLPVIRGRLEAAGRDGATADHEARAVIAVSFACMDAATASLIARDGEGDVMELYDQALALARGTR